MEDTKEYWKRQWAKAVLIREKEYIKWKKQEEEMWKLAKELREATDYFRKKKSKGDML